jgi:tetratricopeptide (TPR) repeat protein
VGRTSLKVTLAFCGAATVYQRSVSLGAKKVRGFASPVSMYARAATAARQHEIITGNEIPMQSEDASTSKCRTCGYASPALNGTGATYLLVDSQVEGLEAFLLHALDECRCEVDDTPLGVSPTILYTGRDPAVFYVSLGSRAELYREDYLLSIRPMAEELQSGLEMKLYPSHSKLRDGITAHLTRRLGEVNELLNARASGGGWNYITQNVDALDSQLFATAHLACNVPQIKIVAHRADGTELSREDLRKNFGEAQGLSWVALVLRWASGHTGDRKLETEMQRHIEAGTMLDGAFAEACHWLEKMLDGELDFRSEYIVHAILSSLYAAAEIENPHAAAWTASFFTAELARGMVQDSEAGDFDALRVSAERAQATIPHKTSWDVVGRHFLGRQELVRERFKASGQIELTPEDRLWQGAMQAACEKAGHPNLLVELSKELKVDGISQFDAQKLISGVREATEESSLELALAALGPLTNHLVQEGRALELEEAAGNVFEGSDGGHEVQAQVDSWLGERLKLMRMPQRFLDRIGVTQRPWEPELSAMTKVRLWTERSNALRMVGRLDEALHVIEDVIRDFPSTGAEQNLRVALRNRAILLRDTGALDEALRQFQEILPRTQGRERLDTLDSLAFAQVEAGEYLAALATYDDGVRLAGGPYADAAPLMKTGRASVLALLSRDAEAVAELTALGSDFGPMEMLRAGSGWANVLISGVEIGQESLDVAAAVVQGISSLHEGAEEAGDVQMSVGTLRLLASLIDGFGEDRATDMWAQAYSLEEKYRIAHSPMGLVRLAQAAASKGERGAFRALMAELPEALANAVGATFDIVAASRNLTPRIREYTRGLARAIVESDAPMEDVRLTAELQRDMAGRAQLVRNAATPIDLADRLRDESIAQEGLGPLPVAVIEWLDVGSQARAFVTTLSPAGAIACDFLDDPPIDLKDFTVAVRSRLDGWRPSRKGEPFDLPGWKELEAWFTEQIESRLPENGHLVLIETTDNWGFPWHVLGRRWTCSYAASWSTLLAAREAKPQAGRKVLGLVIVPKSFEPERLVRFMRSSAERSRIFVPSSGWTIAEERDETRNDRDAFTAIAESCSVAKLICHGYVGAAQHDVAFMLAHRGQLPLLSGAAETEIGKAHRFGWRDCARLVRAPSVVFSAACGTGRAHALGMDERLGIFPGLMRAGTRGFVGPKWDFYPELTLPVLDEALESYLSGGTPLAACVHRACRNAEQRLPLWLAWNLTLEGDWGVQHI